MKRWHKVLTTGVVAITLLACNTEGVDTDTPEPTQGPDPDVVAACNEFYGSLGPNRSFTWNDKWKLPLGLRTQLKSYDAAEERGEDTRSREERITDDCIDRGVRR